MADRTTLLFVHGTNVRAEGYEKSFRAVSAMAASRNPEWDVASCFWGEHFGATLEYQGASIPRDPGAPAAMASRDDEIALWTILQFDPLYELRILALEEPPAIVVGRSSGDDFAHRMETFRPSARTAELFASLGLRAFLENAVRDVCASSELRKAAASAPDNPVEHGRVVCRAIVASTIVAANAEGTPLPSGWMRDRLVDMLATDLGSNTLMAHPWISRKVVSLIEHLASPILATHRSALTERSTPAVGDILRFVARPGPVEQYIADRIASLSGSTVYLLGHSLGGVICVDLLAREPTLNVAGVITVGSQVAYLHEVGALPALAPGSRLPDNMPRWLNIFDRRDVFGFAAEPVFGGKVRDVEVDSAQPFLHAHAAYWGLSATWDAIEELLES